MTKCIHEWVVSENNFRFACRSNHNFIICRKCKYRPSLAQIRDMLNIAMEALSGKKTAAWIFEEANDGS